MNGPLDPAEIRRQLQAADLLTVADARGKAFEVLAEYVFRSLGCPVRRNLISPLHSEQIDLAVVHMGVLAPLPTFFLVECKYWEKPVDSAAVGYFLHTCASRNVQLGIIISKHGITGDPGAASAAHSLAYGSSLLGIHLIVLTVADLLNVPKNEDLVNLLIFAWMQAVGTGGVGTS